MTFFASSGPVSFLYGMQNSFVISSSISTKLGVLLFRLPMVFTIGSFSTCSIGDFTFYCLFAFYTIYLN